MQISVLFILNSLSFGGAEKQVISLVNGLDNRRFKLSLGYLKDNTDLLSQVDKDRLDNLLSFDVTRKVDWDAVKGITKFIDQHNIDIIVSTNTYPLIYSFLASRLSVNKPEMVSVFHTTKLRGIKSKLQMLIYRPLFLLQKRLIYVCETQRAYWRKRWLRARSDMVIYNGVDTKHFKDTWTTEQKAVIRGKYSFDQSDYVIGICAALRPEKAHGDLLVAVHKLKLVGINAKCLIIGDGVVRHNIEQQIIELELDDDVFITGFKEDVRPLIAACNVMAIVSHSVETFSIAVLESMSLGKPMVMSDIGGAREQIKPGRNGYLYRAGDIEGLTQALADLVEKDKQVKFGEKSRELVTGNFGLERMIDCFDSALTNIRATS